MTHRLVCKVRVEAVHVGRVPPLENCNTKECHGRWVAIVTKNLALIHLVVLCVCPSGVQQFTGICIQIADVPTRCVAESLEVAGCAPLWPGTVWHSHRSFPGRGRYASCRWSGRQTPNRHRSSWSSSRCIRNMIFLIRLPLFFLLLPSKLPSVVVLFLLRRSPLPEAVRSLGFVQDQRLVRVVLSKWAEVGSHQCTMRLGSGGLL